jgi:hypothetical protein
MNINSILIIFCLFLNLLNFLILWHINRKIRNTIATGSNRVSTPQVRDKIIRLKEQGWTVEQIAIGSKLSKPEVELILELLC